MGTYPLTATLSGPAAGNYLLGTVTGMATVTPAPTGTTVASLASSAAVGAPIGIAIHTVSSTSGTPTGSVSLLDGTTVVAAAIPLASGGVTYSISSLSPGTHSLAAVYSGDHNFLGSSSPVATVAVGAGPDFTLAATGTGSQSIPSGSTADFSFSVNTVGGDLASPITLSVDGLPIGATASLNPSYLPPGAPVTAFTLAVLTSKTAVAETQAGSRGGVFAALLGSPIAWAWRRRRRLGSRFPMKAAIFASTTCILFATLTSGCGNRVNTGTELHSAPSYTLTVTGTATSASGSVLKHSATVTLQVL